MQWDCLMCVCSSAFQCLDIYGNFLLLRPQIQFPLALIYGNSHGFRWHSQHRISAHFSGALEDTSLCFPSMVPGFCNLALDIYRDGAATASLCNPCQIWFPDAVNSTHILDTIFYGTHLYTYILHIISGSMAFHKKRQIK